MPKQKILQPEFSFNHLDHISSEGNKFASVKQSLEHIALFYGFEPVGTSPFEESRIFSPLVRAGMMQDYAPVEAAFINGINVVLRPSGALSVMRAYKAHQLYDLPHPLKFLFQGERFFAGEHGATSPQSRFEQSLVMIGEEGPVAEALIMQVIWKALLNMGMPPNELMVGVSAVGCAECHTVFRSSFGSYFRTRSGILCKHCKHFAKSNPLRVLSCREEKCAIALMHAPHILDFLCEVCKKHLRGFFEFLDEIKIPYYLDARRYASGTLYNTLMFEFAVQPAISAKGEQDSTVAGEPAQAPVHKVIIAEGGPISRAAELINGRPAPTAAGTVFPYEIAKLASVHAWIPLRDGRPRVFLAQLGEMARRKSLAILEMLRSAEIPVKESLGRDAIKSQLKVAEKIGAELALIVGQKEAIDETVIVREVDSGIQEIIPLEKLIDFLRRKLIKRS